MTIDEALSQGLTIKSNLWTMPSGDNRYKPEYMSAHEVSQITGIDVATIKAACRRGLKHRRRNDKAGTIEVRMHEFVSWALYKYRFRSMNSAKGKAWTAEEKADIEKANRSHVAKRIMKCRLRKLKTGG